MARTVDDLVLLDGIISEGPTSLEPASLEGVRLGLPKPFVDDLDAETQAVFEEVVKKLTEAGAVLVPLDLGNVSELNAKAGGAIALWETKRDLGAYLAAHGSELTVEQLAAEIASPYRTHRRCLDLANGGGIPDLQRVLLHLVIGKESDPFSIGREKWLEPALRPG